MIESKKCARPPKEQNTLSSPKPAVHLIHKVLKKMGISRHKFGSIPNPHINPDEAKRKRRQTARRSRKSNR